MHESDDDLARLATAGSLGAGARPWPPRELMVVADADRARDGKELVGVFADQVLAPTGAVALGVWLLAPDGVLELLGESGASGLAMTRWRRLPPGFDCPPQRVVRDGADLWWHQGPPDDDPAM
ncbi:MAG TPA: hypothetical protein VF979_03750, partial [Streptosporangiaceae bacterium]